MILIPGVQNMVGHIITSKLSDDIGTEVSIKNIRFYPIKELVINDLLIKNISKDTLLFIDEISATIDSVDFTSKNVYLGRITLNKLKTEIIKDSLKTNYQFILDSLLNKQSEKSLWSYNTNEVYIKNSSIAYKNESSLPSKTKFNSNDIRLSSLHLLLDNINIKSDSISARIKELSVNDHSGIQIKNTKGEIGIGKKSFSLKNLRLSANHSYLSIDHFNVSYDSAQAFKDFYSKVPFDLKINSLSADYKDFSLFIPNFPNFHDHINLKGSFSGTVSNLKGVIAINAGSNSELQTNFDITGLPKISDSYIYLNIKKLTTNIPDLTKITSLNADTKDFDFPKSFDKMGEIEYSGKISGFANNLVAYGRFKTDLGIIKTDIGFKITNENKLVYSGFLNTESFNIGKLINSSENLNKLTMDVSIQGYRTQNYQFNSYIKGTVDSIDFKNYKYKKMILNGLLSNNRFDGQIRLNDPNAQLDFNGKVDFKNEIPEFDFVATLNNVKLDKLNIAPKLYNSNINLKLKSNLSGKNINDVLGEILLYDGELITEDNEIKLDTFVITSTINNEIKQLSIKSNLVDANLIGRYNLKTLPKELKQEIAKYLPALFSLNDDPIDKWSHYSLNIHTKKLSSLFETILPDIVVSDGSIINLNLDRKKDLLQVEGQFDRIRYKSINSENVSVVINTNDHKLFTNFNSELITFGNIIPLHNFNISQQAAGDSMAFNCLWDNSKEKLNRGSIYTNTKFKKSFDGKVYTLVNLLPSSIIIINDTTWQTQESSINITPNGLHINTFRIWHINQEMNINGSLSQNSTGKLISNFQNIDISNITQLINSSTLKCEGMLNGHVEIKDNLLSPIITSNLQLDDLVVNDEDVGNLFIESNWDKEKKAVILNAEIRKKETTPLSGGGYFKPSNKDYHFSFELDSLPVGFLNLYLSSAIQNLKGTVSGKIDLLDSKYGFGLDGDVNLNKSSFDIDLLKCSFFVKDSVSFTPEYISFKNMAVTDTYGNKGSFNGSIHHESFSNMSYDLFVSANNMQLLNSQEKDNPLYYGTVFGTGNLTINGITDDLKIDINAKTEKNTKFFIPMSDRQESLDNNFIQFINKSDTLEKGSVAIEEEYKVDLTNYTLNMGIEVTPEAQIQVIFDPAMGDIIKCTGKGNLQIKTNKEGDVSFFGDYVAKKGDYFFSLENVVNKRFDINEGGTVIWEGDPYNAIIDLTATYKLKTSIQPLILPSSSESTDNAESTRRVPIHCNMILSDRLSLPTIQFDISAPTMDQSTQTLIKDAINTKEELNRQVLSLLVLNKFYTPNYNASNSGGTKVNSAAIANTSEVLSSQLSNWLSQISNDVDVGVSYRPEDEISSEQIEVALSTQIFNDRVTLNGNVEYGKFSQTQQNSSNIVGDFDMDVKLNKSGNLRAKAYTHSNDDFSFDNSPTTEGVGISYREEFNTFGELIRKYWYWITGKAKKEKDIKIEKDKTDTEGSNN